MDLAPQRRAPAGPAVFFGVPGTDVVSRRLPFTATNAARRQPMFATNRSLQDPRAMRRRTSRNSRINIHDADKNDIKRFGYHGIAVAASIDALWNAGKLPPKVIVCHLGSESSVTGVFHGRSIDTTTGFSPHEGLMSATSSGTLDVVAADALKTQLSLDDAQFEDYLGTKSGLSGLADESSIEKLFEREADGNHMAHLGLTTYIHTIHKAIGSMIVAMNGCDLLVFSGEIGEHSAALRKRLTAHLQCMDFTLDGELNDGTTEPTKPVFINQQAKSRPIVVIPTDEARYMASHIQKIL